MSKIRPTSVCAFALNYETKTMLLKKGYSALVLMLLARVLKSNGLKSNEEF